MNIEVREDTETGVMMVDIPRTEIGLDTTIYTEDSPVAIIPDMGNDLDTEMMTKTDTALRT